MKRWRRLSIELAVAVLGHRVEIDLVPFQWARPQITLSAGMGRPERLPALKIGPLHVWVMHSDKLELSLCVDLRAAFHTHVFQRVYHGSMVWPDYTPMKRKML